MLVFTPAQHHLADLGDFMRADEVGRINLVSAYLYGMVRNSMQTVTSVFILSCLGKVSKVAANQR